jgi:hypothetical protein
MLFAFVIIFLIGGMEIFLFNNFYGTMKARDTGKLADNIRRSYMLRSENEDFSMSDFIQSYATSNDIYILIAKPDGDSLSIVSSSFGSDSYPSIPSTEYNEKLWDLYEKISRDTSNDDIPLPVRSAETMLESVNGSGKVLAFACFLEKPAMLSGLSRKDSGKRSGTYSDQTFQAASSNVLVMYILNPLYPTTSTVRILYNILVTIMFFAMFLVVIIALYLAKRITRPIRDITRSAEQMAQGDFFPNRAIIKASCKCYVLLSGSRRDRRRRNHRRRQRKLCHHHRLFFVPAKLFETSDAYCGNSCGL